MIDISTLPSLQLSSKGDLPVAPGVYVVMDGNSVLYVGKATTLRLCYLLTKTPGKPCLMVLLYRLCRVPEHSLYFLRSIIG